MKQKITIALVFAFICMVSVPSVADAAWWNPFSWFKKKVTPPVTMPASNFNRPTTTIPTSTPSIPLQEKATGNATSSSASSKPLPVTAKPPVTTMPVQAKPVIKTIATSSPSTSTPSSSSPKPVSIDEIPYYVLNSAFTPSGFISPRSVENGTILLMIEADRGTSTQALGNWYTDKVVWKIVSEEYRSGDLTVSVSSGQKSYEDVSLINELHTTNLVGHVASDPIVFTINGQTPRKGNVVILVDSLYGHVKTATSTSYKFNGTPLTSPSFRITD